jgi:glycosyltransferase involved in cell wall biosynthesis
MRIALVYDCLYPWTVGGAERWMRALAEALAGAGHEVTYLTRRQWEPGDEPRIPGVRVVAVSPAEPLYGPDGNRLIGEPLRFGRGVTGHLLRHRGRYDVVHSCSFPYFSVLGAAAALRGTGVPLFVDWFEVWSPAYWNGYLGGIRGRVGGLVQRACARVPQQPFVFSDLHGRRLAQEGARTAPRRLAGLYAGPLDAEPAPTAGRAPLVVFAGRHIPDKRVPVIPAAVAAARERVPGLHALVLGDGPDRPRLLAAIGDAGMDGVVRAPGFVDAAEVEAAIRRAACLLLPSQREGYGLVVVEAAAAGTPSVVAAGPDNAAVELVEPGVNGVVAATDAPRDLADALVAAVEGGDALRERTAAWFAANARRLSVRASLEQVLAAYEEARGAMARP